MGCQESVRLVKGPNALKIDTTYTAEGNAEQMISPYKKKLDTEMNEVLVVSSEEMPREKNKIETKLGNLVADLSMNHAAWNLYNDRMISKPAFCVLNFGGLRTSLPKGNITMGKIYELMPFENELVLVTITEEKVHEFIQYIKEKGPQPTSGITISINKKNWGRRVFMRIPKSR